VSTGKEYARPEYQYVVFFADQRPDGLDAGNGGAIAIKLASELFGFQPADYNPKHGGRCYGVTKYGLTFEVHVKWGAAEGLVPRSLPQIVNIFE